MITEIKAKSARPKEKRYQISAGDGLSLVIEPTGVKFWRYSYKSEDGTRKTKKLGDYPTLSVKQAFIAKVQFIDQVQETKQQNNQVINFKFVANEWLHFKTMNALGDIPKKGVLVLASKCIEQDFIPLLGDMLFTEIKRLDLVKVIRNIEQRGVKEPCKKACSYLNQIFDYAVSVGYIDFNIAIGLNKILIKTKIKKNYAFLNSIEIVDFYQKIASAKCDPIIRKALSLKVLTGVRGAEILNAKADQFDLDAGLWSIPAIHVKQLRQKVIEGHNIPDYVIPLSRQAMDVVRSAIEWSHGERYLFASPTKAGQHIHYNSINSVIRRMGYDKNTLTSHGLRASMSTVLHESDLFKSEWIEAQLSHTDKNAVRGTYNHAEYINHRAKMMQWWADYLEGEVNI